ncbi:hypothetical protein R9C00_21340 [Flammeovirgaceae bacterium SG7u.111]|nr:hypothetical protein [Flammeovirgaceae bacterium SG7u.132]WPO34247.1 hypothetical protein R9C00_21340 [Flammeovirgaceae bacterium SG7u.111]
MNIKEALLEEHSKEQMLLIAKYIGENEERLAELMEVFLKGEPKVQQRSAWALYTTFEKYNLKKLILPYLAEMINLLDKPVHDAVVRNTVHIMEVVDIPTELHGEAVDQCFKLLMDNNSPIAIKAFSMTVIYNVSQHFPELKNELKLVIEDLLPYASPGLRNRGGKILKKLCKEIE